MSYLLDRGNDIDVRSRVIWEMFHKTANSGGVEIKCDKLKKAVEREFRSRKHKPTVERMTLLYDRLDGYLTLCVEFAEKSLTAKQIAAEDTVGLVPLGKLA